MYVYLTFVDSWFVLVDTEEDTPKKGERLSDIAGLLEEIYCSSNVEDHGRKEYFVRGVSCMVS